MKTLLVLAVVALSAMSVWAAPHKSVKIPSVGDVFGPIEKSGPGTLTKVGKRFLWSVAPDDQLVDVISAQEVFQTKQEALEYVRERLNENSAVVQVNLDELEGSYVEVLNIKPLTTDEIQFVCHVYAKNIFCHDFTNNGHVNKYAYAMVRRMDDHNTVFPVVFFSHKACNKKTCFWVTHLSTLSILNKRFIVNL